MKLLYLYVETWPTRCISKGNPIEVNFERGYKFQYNPAVNKLSCTTGEELPKGFFSVSSSEASVDSVSVIIGNNGTGKTTLASVLGYLFKRGRHLPEYICIYKQAENLVLFYNFESGRGAPDYSSVKAKWVDAEIDSNYDSDLQHDSPFDIIYYSPYFSTNEIWPGNARVGTLENNSLCDLSTGYLAQHAKPIGPDVTQIKAFKSQDYERVLRFAHKYVNDFSVKGVQSMSKIDGAGPILPLPKYAQFLVDITLLIPVARAEVLIMANVRNGNLEDLICTAGSNNPLWEIASVVLLYISRSTCKEVGDQDLAVLNKVLREVCLASKSLYMQTSNACKGREFAEKVSRIKFDDGGSITRSLMKVLRPMARIYGKMVDRKRGGKYVLGNQVDITDKRDLDDVIDVNRHWPEFESRLGKLIGSSVSLMNVSIANMASGEMAYWTLFARIYDALESMKEKKNGRDILLFLDEAETTLHPEWQRHLVRNVIWFWEKYADGRHVHIIFATHSPMILSDIPKDNVVILGDARQTRIEEYGNCAGNKQMALDGLVNTFGANIFELYRLAFNQSNGTTGEFATNTIKDALGKVAEVVASRVKCSGTDNVPKGLDEDTKQVLSQIGDPLIRKYLEGLRAGELI